MFGHLDVICSLVDTQDTSLMDKQDHSGTWCKGSAPDRSLGPCQTPEPTHLQDTYLLLYILVYKQPDLALFRECKNHILSLGS